MLYDEIYERYKDRILSYCKTLPNGNIHNAEDCTQEIFLKLSKINNIIELAEKFKGTSVYSKGAIGNILASTDKYKLDIQSTNAFSAEAYITPDNTTNDKYTIDFTKKNLTSDELSVNLSKKFYLCYNSNRTNPTAYAKEEEYTFLPYEEKQFSFDVEADLWGTEDDKVIYGSCVLEITNSDKYDYFNVLSAEPYIVERIKNEENN
ncbi:MAG: hypothetical protein LIO69_07140 [Oscillospiraceae bacterium]|nr:hypothetical protein [Oscillospiraceae bacterium]